MDALTKEIKQSATKIQFTEAEAKKFAAYLVAALADCITSVLKDTSDETRKTVETWLKKGARRLKGFATKGSRYTAIIDSSPKRTPSHN